MKKTLISIAVASAMVSGAAMASGHGGYNSPSTFIYKNTTVDVDYTGPSKTVVDTSGVNFDVNVDLGVTKTHTMYKEDTHLLQANSIGTGSTLSGASSTSEAHGGIVPTRSRPAPADPYAENFSASKSTVISGGESSAAEWDNSFDTSGRGSERFMANQSGDTSSLDIKVEASRESESTYCWYCSKNTSSAEISGSLEADKTTWDNTVRGGSRYEYSTHLDENGAATYSKGGTIQGSETYSGGFAVDEGTNQGWAKSDGSAIGATEGLGAADGVVLDTDIHSHMNSFTLDFHGDANYQQWDNHFLDKDGGTLSVDYDKTFIMSKKGGYKGR